MLSWPLACGLCIAISSSSSHIRQKVAEKVNHFEPTRCLQKEEDAPQITVASAVSSFPVEDRQDIAVDQAGKCRKHRENAAKLRQGGAAMEDRGHQKKRKRQEGHFREPVQYPEFVGERVHAYYTLTTQAQRPGPRGRLIATATRWPGGVDSTAPAVSVSQPTKPLPPSNSFRNFPNCSSRRGAWFAIFMYSV